MAEETKSEVAIPPAIEVLVPADDKVLIEGVVPELMTFAVQVAYVHWILFGSPLVITSGKDERHHGWSFHGLGRALDFRTQDKTDAEMLIFSAILIYAAPVLNLRVFDCRVGPDGELIHVEFIG